MRGRDATLHAGVSVLVGMVVLALAAPLFGDPYATPVDGLTLDGVPYGVLDDGHLLGTDILGRDLAARVAHGARATLGFTVAATITSVGLGAIVGVLAGFYRGWVEHVLMRLTDTFLAIPTVVSGLALASIFGTGLVGIVIVVTALYWAWTARLVFGETLRLRRRAFVDAASAMGVPGRTIVRRHILPHLSGLLLTLTALNAASVVAIGAGLSYLGAGVQPPRPEWGTMLGEGQDAIDYAPHLLLAPLICIVLVVFALVLVSHSLARRGAVSLRGSWLDT